jgi:hypothetical protein
MGRDRFTDPTMTLNWRSQVPPAHNGFMGHMAVRLAFLMCCLSLVACDEIGDALDAPRRKRLGAKIAKLEAEVVSLQVAQEVAALKAHTEKTVERPRLKLASLGTFINAFNASTARGELWFTNVSSRTGVVCVRGTSRVTHAKIEIAMSSWKAAPAEPSIARITVLAPQTCASRDRARTSRTRTLRPQTSPKQKAATSRR